VVAGAPNVADQALCFRLHQRFQRATRAEPEINIRDVRQAVKVIVVKVIGLYAL